MRSLIVILLILFGLAVASPVESSPMVLPISPGSSVSAIQPVFAGIVPQWLTEGLKNIASEIVDRIRKFFDDLVSKLKDWVMYFGELAHKMGKNIYDAFEPFFTYFSGLLWEFAVWFYDVAMWFWDGFCALFEGIIDFFWWCLEWFYDAFNSITDFLAGCFDSAIEMVSDFWESLKEMPKWIGKLLFDYLIGFIDWLIGTGMTFIDLVIDKLPEIPLPEGFQTGLRFAMQFAMILDDYVPVIEIFRALYLYLSFLTGLIIFRFIRSLIPFI